MPDPNIGQILAASYAAVVNRARTPENQWAENAVMTHLEKLGFIKTEDLGNVIEHTLDYRRNPGATFLASDVQNLSTQKTEVLDAVQYAIAELAVPIRWTNKDEVRTPSVNAKINFVGSLIKNALTSHDELLEEAFFATSTEGWLGMLSLAPESGQGSPGGVDASTDVFWRNPAEEYTDDTDIEQVMTSVYNQAAKGSGATLVPTLAASDAETHALFEGTQTPLQRWENTQEARVGFKVLWFKTAQYIFSQFGTDSIYFMNPKNLNMIVSKKYFRNRREATPLQGTPGWESMVYSAGNTTTNNKSRLGVAFT